VKRIFIAVLLLSLFAPGCGDDDDPSGPGPATNEMSANVDGQSWQADQSAITVQGNANSPFLGTLSIAGTELGGTNENITLVLSFVSGPGTYPLGVNILTNAGGTGAYTQAPSTFITTLTGEAGVVTITTRTNTRIAGTFSFEATEISGPGTVNVTNGKFDITVEGGLPALPTGSGSVMSANLDGDFWNASTILSNRQSANQFNLVVTNTEYSMTMTSVVDILAGNIYGIPGQIQLTINRFGTIDSWQAQAGPNVATVSIIESTEGQLVGSFSGSIPQISGGTTALAISDGQFNVFFQPVEGN